MSRTPKSQSSSQSGGRGLVWSNKVVGTIARFGAAPRDCHELLVAGRVSGRITARPVNVMESGGTRYLLCPRGQTQWVRNVRAGQPAVLRRRRRTEAVELVEVADDRNVELIRTYLSRWGWQVSGFVDGLSAASSNAELEAASSRFPIFECVPVRE